MAYREEDLAPTDTTRLTWAIAWTRFYLRDTAEAFIYTDAELSALLSANAFEDNEGATYYRPHVVAGLLVETDPDRALSESTLGASVTNREPSSIARSIRRAGAWIDDVIEELTELRPSTSLTLRARF